MENIVNIISATIQNFGSYKKLEFSFDKQGLCLIQGLTGSGKSTLMDIVPWVLFGVTAKDGSVDEVKSWDSNGDTEGRLIIDLNGVPIIIQRIRGKTNDLHYSQQDVPGITRGKDLKDTQKQINQLLGITPETYLAGAYFHEFSKAASFFITSAKSRREICEQIVDLSFTKQKQATLTFNYKTISNLSQKLNIELIKT